MLKTPESLCRARELFYSLVLKGSLEGECRYAYMLERGLGGSRDLIGALELYEKSGENGNLESLHRAGMIYSEVNSKSEPTVYYLTKACVGGYGPALRDYGNILMRSSVEAEKKKSREYLSRAYELNTPGSEFGLGICYEEGIGGEVDMMKARELFKVGSENGNTDSMYFYADFLRKGKGGVKDVIKAWRILKQASELGHDLSAALLLEMNEKEEGGVLTPQEIEKYENMSTSGSTPNDWLCTIV